MRKNFFHTGRTFHKLIAGISLVLAVSFFCMIFSGAKKNKFTPQEISLTLCDEINSANNQTLILHNDISRTSFNLDDTFSFFPDDFTDSEGNDYSFAGWYYENGALEEKFSDWDYREEGYTLLARYNPILSKQNASGGNCIVRKTYGEENTVSSTCRIVRRDYEYATYTNALIFAVVVSGFGTGEAKAVGTKVQKSKWYATSELSKSHDLSLLDMAFDECGEDNYALALAAGLNESRLKAFSIAQNYGTENSLSDGWESGWYIPSRIEAEGLLLRTFETTAKLLSVPSSESFWLSSVDEAGASWVPCYMGCVDEVRGIYFSDNAAANRYVLVFHEIVE